MAKKERSFETEECKAAREVFEQEGVHRRDYWVENDALEVEKDFLMMLFTLPKLRRRELWEKLVGCQKSLNLRRSVEKNGIVRDV